LIGREQSFYLRPMGATTVATVCPAEGELSRFITRGLPVAAAASVENHLADCDDCRNLVFALASHDVASAADTASPAERIGRFEVLDLVGRGAMGTVYRARDPELDRTVAIKVRHSQSKLDVQQEDRIRREAQALARLADPNVVGVFEAGVHDGKAFVVMEYVDGETLQAWMSTTTAKRSVAQIIAMLAQAGRGLAAAHAAGLVHRDFKPSNVLVSRAQIAKVGDFGLVRVDNSADTGERGEASGDVMLTMSGALLGTPAYMAPEQLVGDVATEASDQFSFCVALYEALYGRRPFRGTTLPALRAAMSGAVSFPASPRVPANVKSALARGLAIVPARRWASMRALLEVLERRPRRTWPILVGAAAIAAAGATTVWASTRVAEDPCAGAEQQIASVWNATSKDAIRAKMLATNVPYARDAWVAVERTLDAYAATWTQARRGACEATRVHHEQPERVLALRTNCLDERLTELRTFTAALAEADKDVVGRSVRGASQLGAIAQCGDVRTLTESATSGITAARTKELRDDLARGASLAGVGKSTEAIEVFESVLAAAKREGQLAIEANALVDLAKLKFRRDRDPVAAEKALTSALLAADRAHDDYLRARAYTVLLFIVGVVQNRFDDGDRLFEQGRAVLGRLVGAEVQEAQMLGNRGQFLLFKGEHETAEKMLRDAVAVIEKNFSPDHLELGAMYAMLSEVTMRMGDQAEGLELARRSYEIDKKNYGPNHPETAKSAFNMAMALKATGKRDEGMQLIREVIATLETALGPDHIDLATAVDAYGTMLRGQNKFADAEKQHRRALALREKHLGPDDPQTGISLDNLGLAVGFQERLAEAMGYHERALAISEKIFGADHIEVAGTLAYMATLHRQLDKLELALAEYQRTLAIYEKGLGPDAYDNSFPLSGIGHVLLDLKRPREAIAPLERAKKIRDAREGGDPMTNAQVDFALGRAFYESAVDKARGLELATKAEPQLPDIDRAQAKAWLATHR
jgi:tetratricopeptide (TPR) repeat protein/tRNA A-37 threonylcarbamoyl transferase component Bud32